jgi:hypothetical protein
MGPGRRRHSPGRLFAPSDLAINKIYSIFLIEPAEARCVYAVVRPHAPRAAFLFAQRRGRFLFQALTQDSRACPDLGLRPPHIFLGNR